MNRYLRDASAEIQHWKTVAHASWCACFVMAVCLAVIIWRTWP